MSEVSKVVAEVCSKPGYGQPANEEAVNGEAHAKPYAAMMTTMMAIFSIIINQGVLAGGSFPVPSGQLGASGPMPRTTTIRSR